MSKLHPLLQQAADALYPLALEAVKEDDVVAQKRIGKAIAVLMGTDQKARRGKRKQTVKARLPSGERIELWQETIKRLRERSGDDGGS